MVQEIELWFTNHRPLIPALCFVDKSLFLFLKALTLAASVFLKFCSLSGVICTHFFVCLFCMPFLTPSLSFSLKFCFSSLNMAFNILQHDCIFHSAADKRSTCEAKQLKSKVYHYKIIRLLLVESSVIVQCMHLWKYQ